MRNFLEFLAVEGERHVVVAIRQAVGVAAIIAIFKCASGSPLLPAKRKDRLLFSHRNTGGQKQNNYQPSKEQHGVSIGESRLRTIGEKGQKATPMRDFS